jgi:hypothetical protein
MKSIVSTSLNFLYFRYFYAFSYKRRKKSGVPTSRLGIGFEPPNQVMFEITLKKIPHFTTKSSEIIFSSRRAGST